MKLRKGNMWSAFDHADMFLITTNSFIRHDKQLVMGAGIAKEAYERFPAVASQVVQHFHHLGVYGLLPWRGWKGVPSNLGLFQVKLHWADPADRALIAYSTGMLVAYLRDWPTKSVHLNFPGIGNGRLARSHVLPIIQTLPDNVTVWEYEND